jgi:hypothetical protein
MVIRKSVIKTKAPKQRVEDFARARGGVAGALFGELLRGPRSIKIGGGLFAFLLHLRTKVTMAAAMITHDWC